MPIHERLLELARYGLVSLLAFVIDVAALAALVKFAYWHYLAAAAVSFILGGVLAYLLCIRFVFRYRRIDHTGLELSSFVGLGLVGLAVNTVVIYLAVEYAGLALPFAKLSASAGTFITNYLLRRMLLFTPMLRSETK